MNKNPNNSSRFQVKLSPEELSSLRESVSIWRSRIGNLEIPVNQVQASLKFAEKFKPQNPWFVEHDWYISQHEWWSMAPGDVFVTNPRKLEMDLMKRFDSEIQETKKRLKENQSERAKLIDEVFYLYKNKKYHGLITLTYSLVDGITRKRFGIDFSGYDSTKGLHNSKIVKELVQLPDFYDILSKQLDYRRKINGKFDSIPPMEVTSTNNRHYVMHGDSYRYGTKKNAIKAILLLEFVSTIPKKK